MARRLRDPYQFASLPADVLEQSQSLGSSAPSEPPAPAEQSMSEPQPEETAAEAYFDPADHTVAEVLDFARGYPDTVVDLIDAERAGKNRTTLIRELETM